MMQLMFRDVGPWPQVRIAPNWMSGSNQQVRARQLWGSDVYTDDSDLVAALMHSGFYSISLNQCPPTVSPSTEKLCCLMHSGFHSI
jgi:Histone deacetylation protein Rxt3